MSTPKTSLRSWLGVTALEDRSVPSASLVDRNATLTGPGNGSAVVLGTSDDGRYAIFSSTATNLVQGQVDIPGTKDLFWTDQLTGEVKLVTNLPTVSIDPTTNKTNYSYDAKTTYSQAIPGMDSFSEAVISGNGKFVAFNSLLDASMIDSLYITQSQSPNSTDITRTVAPDRGDSTLDVFRWEAQTGKTMLASRTYYNATGSTGAVTNVVGNPQNPNQAFGRRTDAIDPAISTDGTRVSFVSKYNAQDVVPQRFIPAPTQPNVTRYPNGAENLVFDNGDSSNDIFMTDFTDLGTSTFTPSQENANNYYTTVMSKLFSGDRTVFDVDTSTLIPVTTDYATYPTFTTFGDEGTTQIQVDPLGRYLGGDGLTATFVSNVDTDLLNLRSAAAGTFNRRTYAHSTNPNVYWTQFGSTTDVANIVRVVTTGSDTTPTSGTVTSSGGGGGTATNAILARNDSSSVLFLTSVGSTAGSQIVTKYGGDTANQHLYYREMNDEIGGPAILVDSTSTAVATPGNGVLPPVSSTDTDIDPASYQIAGNGSAAVFTSTSSNLFPAATLKDTNKAGDIFAKNLITNTLEGISVITTGKATGASAAFHPHIGPDGRYVTFESVGTDYVDSTVTADTNLATDVFLRDRTGKTTAYISAISNGAASGNGASTGAFVGNLGLSGYITFTSASTDLDVLYTITNGNTDVYVVRLPLSGTGSTDPVLQVSRIAAVSGGSPGSVAYATFGSGGAITIGDRFSPFPGFTGEIRVATGDVDGDGAALPDIIAAEGPGGSPRVVVISGATGQTIMSFLAFEGSFTGGLNVASADINQDGYDDIIVAADIGGGPRVKIISGKDQSTIADFFVFEPSFRGGVRVGTGNIGSISAAGTGQAVNDGVPDIIAGAGEGGGPRISILDGASAAKNQLVRIADFFAFEQTLRNGVYVSGGDFNKDTYDDIVAGAGPGGGPRVTVFDIKTVIATPATPTQLVNFFAFDDQSSRNGVRVAAKNIDGDSVADILVGQGAGNIDRVRAYSGGHLDSTNVPNLLSDTVLFDDYSATNGAWVG